MKETKPYWYHGMAYSLEPYFVCLDFPNLIMMGQTVFLSIIIRPGM